MCFVSDTYNPSWDASLTPWQGILAGFLTPGPGTRSAGKHWKNSGGSSSALTRCGRAAAILKGRICHDIVANMATNGPDDGNGQVRHDPRGPNDTLFGISRAVSLDDRALRPHHGAAHALADPGQKQDPAKVTISRLRADVIRVPRSWCRGSARSRGMTRVAVGAFFRQWRGVSGKA